MAATNLKNPTTITRKTASTTIPGTSIVGISKQDGTMSNVLQITS